MGMWSAYEKIIENNFNLNRKLRSNAVSFTHAVGAIILMYYYNYYDYCNAFVLPAALVYSISYYVHDLKNCKDGSDMDTIMYYHHIGSIILLILGYSLESPNLSKGFLIVEVSNLPLYLTSALLHSEKKDYDFLIKYSILLEFVFFLVFRCILLIRILAIVQTLVVFILIAILYFASAYWTVRLSYQVIDNFITVV